MSKREFVRLLAACSTFALIPSFGSAFPFLRREDWGAKPPRFGMDGHSPTRITIHHTGVAQNNRRNLDQKMRSLQRFSQSNEKLADGRDKQAWADIPYHFYVGVSGTVAEGRSLDFVGDTNTNYNPTGHIGIAVEGNFNTEKPNEKQIDSLAQLISELKSRFDIDTEAIGAHQDFAQTACPGANMVMIIPEILSRVAGN